MQPVPLKVRTNFMHVETYPGTCPSKGKKVEEMSGKKRSMGLQRETFKGPYMLL